MHLSILPTALLAASSALAYPRRPAAPEPVVAPPHQGKRYEFPGLSEKAVRARARAHHRGLTFSHDEFAALETVTSPILGLAEQLMEGTAAAWHALFRGSKAKSAADAGSACPYGDEHDGYAHDSQIYYPAGVNASNPVYVAYGDMDNGGSAGVTDDPATKLKGYTHYNIAFWMVNGGPQDNAQLWSQASQCTQRRLKKKYNDAGIKLMVSAFGATDKPQSSGRSAKSVAKSIADFVIGNNLDGVDIDYEEEDLFDQGKALPWLVALQTELRRRLPSPQYIITHAPIAPWFSWTTQADGGYSAFDDQVGNTVDWYNVQFYNQDLYGDCNGLLFNSGGWCPDASLFQINKLGGVPLSRLVIGKPAHRNDADGSDVGYMDSATLGSCIKQAIPQGYSGSLMFWEYPHASATLLQKVKQAAGLVAC